MNQEQLSKMRHSLAHILAQAVLKMYPKAKLAIGPNIENGFYYDFDLGEDSFSPEDLKKLEKEMKNIVKANQKFVGFSLPIEEAKEKVKNNPYKLEMIVDLEKEGEKEIGFYQNLDRKGNPVFEDMCRGPHVESTGEVGAFKLQKLAGAYWRGDEKNKMLQRVYGLAFATKEELADYIRMMEEAEKRDHRKLGKELDLFVFSDLVGKGLPLLTPKGSIIRQEMERFIIEEETKRDYLRTYTPDLAKVDLYRKSGHWEHYQESMYPPINVDGEDYVLRPMTCPHQFMIYNSRPRSYKELPLRYAELAKLYRKEQSGELTGLIRVMSFTLNDAHIICTPEQVEEEFEKVVDLIQFSMKTLGIDDFWYRYSKWDPNNKEKYVDNPRAWEATQKSMKKILDKMKLNYVEADDEAAFYGPKLDVQMRNVNGKEDTAFTVQIDFSMPEKFEMTYIDQDGSEKMPMIIHRAAIGCFERVMAFLIEKYAGAFPVWLSPVQVCVLPVSDKFSVYATEVYQTLKQAGIRAELDDESESLNKRIRNAEKSKVPYILVVGEKEVAEKTVAVRKRAKGDQGAMKLTEFKDKIVEEYKNRVIE